MHDHLRRLCILPAVCAALLLTSCYSKEQRALNAQWEAQGAENAVRYIQGKYDFTPEVRSAEIDRRRGIYNPQATSDIIVGMSFENRDFTVYITGDSVSDSGRDDYQASEIEQALREKINKERSGLQQLDLLPVCDSSRLYQPAAPLYAAYFDGSNLPAVLSGGITGFRAFYLQTDLSDTEDFAVLDDFFSNECGIESAYYSCRTDELFSLDAETRGRQARLPVCCPQYRKLMRTLDSPAYQTEFHDYQLHQFGDFFWIVSDDPHFDAGQPIDCTPHFEEVAPPEPSAFDGSGTRRAAITSKAYHVSADQIVWLHLFYPCSNITDFDYQGYQNKHTRFATVPEGEQTEKVPSAGPVTKSGEYCCQTFRLAPSIPCTFLFVNDQK